ncbi:RAD55 family ATPase [Halorubrum gandharaense]
MERVPTGVSVLDRELGGGLPVGSIVVLAADPASQSELFLNTFAAAHDTLYLTTVRSEEAVRDGFERSPPRIPDPTIRSVGGKAALDDASDLLSTLPEEANLVIDSLEPLEDADPARYRRFLSELQTRMVNTGGVAILHALKGVEADDGGRNRAMSEQVADVVFDLRTTVTDADIENRLAVPKFRGGAALEEPVKLKLADSVAIDTSRDIA